MFDKVLMTMFKSDRKHCYKWSGLFSNKSFPFTLPQEAPFFLQLSRQRAVPENRKIKMFTCTMLYKEALTYEYYKQDFSYL